MRGRQRASRPVRALKGIVLALCCLVVIGPFVSVVATSLADQDQVAAAGGLVMWPDSPNLDAYKAILSGGQVTRALLISIGITVVGTPLSLLCTTLLAYGLSHPGSYGSKPVLMMVLFSIFFVPGIIPSYLTVKSLNLINSWWSLILPVLVTGFNVVVTRSFFMNLPRELIEAARIDGAGELGIFTRIVLPLSKPIVAVIGLFYAVSYWNSFFTALLYINVNEKQPLQLVLRTYLVNNNQLTGDQLALATNLLPAADSLRMAILVISLVPIMLVYPFVQRHFTSGVLVGAVKG